MKTTRPDERRREPRTANDKGTSRESAVSTLAPTIFCPSAVVERCLRGNTPDRRQA